MQSTFTLFSVAAGLLLSIACAALLEELIFGGIFRLFFAPRPADSAMNTPTPGSPTRSRSGVR